MSIPYGGPDEIPQVEVQVPADEFENMIRKMGVVFACEWFGYSPDSEFTAETVRVLRERSSVQA